MSDLTFAHPSCILPTMEGRVSGIVDRPTECTWTAQCAVCFATATGALILVVNWANFAAHRYHAVKPAHCGPLLYRRCTDCQRAEKHPATIRLEVTA